MNCVRQLQLLLLAYLKPVFSSSLLSRKGATVFRQKTMSQNELENALRPAIEQLVYELGFSSPSQLWDEAGETANRAAWYKRVAPGSTVRTTEKHLTKLIQGLERNGHKLSQEQKDRLYAAIGVKV